MIVVQSMEKHQELETISILCNRKRSREHEHDILMTIFSNSNIRSVNIHDMMSSGEELGRLPVTSSKLEKLCLTSCRNLTDRGLQGLLLGIGNNLTELDLSKSFVTEEGFQQPVKSLPNLENLNLYLNTNLTDDGLYQISKTCGNKLKELNLSFTQITGIKLDKKQDSLDCSGTQDIVSESWIYQKLVYLWLGWKRVLNLSLIWKSSTLMRVLACQTRDLLRF